MKLFNTGSVPLDLPLGNLRFPAMGEVNIREALNEQFEAALAKDQMILALLEGGVITKTEDEEVRPEWLPDGIETPEALVEALATSVNEIQRLSDLNEASAKQVEELEKGVGDYADLQARHDALFVELEELKKTAAPAAPEAAPEAKKADSKKG